MTVTQQHVVITGGGTGIGASITRAFAAAGARVTIIGRRRAPLDDIATETAATALCADVTDADALTAALDQARHQNGLITTAIANAGDAQSQPFPKMTNADLTAALDVNLHGTFTLWQACCADMKQAGGGRMIAIASLLGLRGQNYTAAYCAAKHAVVGLTRALAIELAPQNITVNAICPGYVDTPMLDRSIQNICDKTGVTPEAAAALLRDNLQQNYFIHPDEIAAKCLFLASDAAQTITGEAIPIVDGTAPRINR